MLKIFYCKFNIDTASVETIFSDGSMISIYCPAVDEELNLTAAQQTELDWLLYNNPREFVQMVLSGRTPNCLPGSLAHGLED